VCVARLQTTHQCSKVIDLTQVWQGYRLHTSVAWLWTVSVLQGCRLLVVIAELQTISHCDYAAQYLLLVWPGHSLNVHVAVLCNLRRLVDMLRQCYRLSVLE